MEALAGKVPCKDLTEETVARAISPEYAVDRELQPYLPGLIAAHCEECSGKIHRVLRIREIMELGGVSDCHDAWLAVHLAAERGDPGTTHKTRLAFVVHLLMEEEDLRFNAPREGLETMEQARQTGKMMDLKRKCKALWALVEARYGNALRYNSRHPDARSVLAPAALVVRNVEVPAFVRAEVCLLYATLLSDSRQQKAALETIRESIEAYQSIPDLHLSAVVMIKLAEILHRNDYPAEESLTVLHEAMANIDKLRSPHYSYGCQLQITIYTLRRNDVEQAELIWSGLPKSGHISTEFRRQALGALIDLAKGEFEKASECLEIVINRFLDIGMPNNATVLMLYRSEALLRMGHINKGIDLLKDAYENHAILEICDVEQDSLRKLLDFAQVASAEQLIDKIRKQADMMGGCLPKSGKARRQSG